jgi:hypothetical protein
MRRLLPLILSLAALPAFANLDLTLWLDGPPYSPTNTPTTTPAHVVLAPTWFLYEHGGDVTIRDCATRRIFVTTAKGTIESSMYADVSRALADPNRRQEIADFSVETVEATDAERATFIRFIFNTFTAKPPIISGLLNHAGIPREMRVGSWRLAIANAKHLPDKPYAPIANAHLTIESNDTFGEAAVKALAGIPAGYAERIAADAAGFIRAGDHVTALLTLRARRRES